MPDGYDVDVNEVAVTVIDDNGAAVDLTGITIEAAAYLPRRDLTVAASILEDDFAQGKFTAKFAAGALDVGVWRFQAQVIIGSDPHIVAARTLDIAKGHV